MIKLRYKRLMRSNSKLNNGGRNDESEKGIKRISENVREIKWEVRPGGMLVQKRETVGKKGLGFITIRVSTVSNCYHISIESTSTFGDLKVILSLQTGLEPKEQRILYRGKEREDEEHLHMVGVGDKDKVLLLEDPAIKETKLRGFLEGKRVQKSLGNDTTYHTIRI